MRITDIELIPYTIELKKPFIISLGVMTHARNLAVRIQTDVGITGWGECSPFLPVNGESQDTGVIVGGYIKKAIVGMDPTDIEYIHEVMDKVIYGNSSIKSAFDIALYDIASQRAELPLYKFLGGNKNKKLVTDYTVSFGHVEEMVKSAVEIQGEGFRIIKVKVGGKPAEDIRRIFRIREVLDPRIPIRLDANQGWTIDGAIEVLNSVRDCNIELCEEPIARWDFQNLSKIKKESPIPIMADESCLDHHDAKRLINMGACDSINIKLGKSSGIFNALKIIELACLSKVPIQIGGFLESRLAFTASAHLAYCSECVVGIDFDTPLMFKEDPVEGGIKYSKGGEIDLPEAPGLGARLVL